MIQMVLANIEDVWRLHELEAQGHFKHGFTAQAMRSVTHYLERIAWLRAIRAMPGAPPYLGPLVSEGEIADGSADQR